MRKLLDAYKPAASARIHLLLAAIMWTAVGAALLFVGGRWALAGETAHAWALIAAAVWVGLLKAMLVLNRTAARLIERIRTRGDERCVGGFLSLRSWAFVALMVGAGRILRGGFLSRLVVGLVYVSVGTALLLAAWRLWHAWYCHNARA